MKYVLIRYLSKSILSTENTNDWKCKVPYCTDFDFKHSLTYTEIFGSTDVNELVKNQGITIYFTSEENSYGIIDQKWMNGEEMNIDTKFGTSKTIKIRPKIETLLVETSRCVKEHYYKCYGSKLISEMDKVKLNLGIVLSLIF